MKFFVSQDDALVMAALRSRGHYIFFALWFLLLFTFLA